MYAYIYSNSCARDMAHSTNAQMQKANYEAFRYYAAFRLLCRLKVSEHANAKVLGLKLLVSAALSYEC